MAEPVNIAAIDAGSNALRIVIARAESPHDVRVLATERFPVRLGHRAFTERRLDKKSMARAVKAFRHFRAVMEAYGVESYRAVATSAVREARNRKEFVARVLRKTGLHLEIIDGTEEARLVRAAVLGAVSPQLSPRLVVDLGGGSLEFNLLRPAAGLRYSRDPAIVDYSRTLPVGTVRLLESLQLRGAMSDDEVIEVRNYVLAMLRSSFRRPPNLAGALAVACGGNAEALAQFASGPAVRIRVGRGHQALNTLNIRLLRERLWDILSRDVPRRMKVFRVRKDRADVMAVAAIVFLTLARWLNLRSFLVPGVGVREGVLRDLVLEHFAADISAAEEKKARALMTAARWFAAKHHASARHNEQVQRLAISLFDQLTPLHRMGLPERRLLELGAVLHDIGHFINKKAHGKHGEYLVRNGKIGGLKGWRSDFVACLVRYHNPKSDPDLDHKLYASLDPLRRRQVRVLTAILRVAEGLDRDHKQAVAEVSVGLDCSDIDIRVRFRAVPARLAGQTIAAAQRKVSARGGLENEFGVRTRIRKAALRRPSRRARVA